MFWVGVVCVSMCSWLLAVAVVANMVLERQLSSAEKIAAFASAIAFSAVVTKIMWRRVREKDETFNRNA